MSNGKQPTPGGSAYRAGDESAKAIAALQTRIEELERRVAQLEKDKGGKPGK